MTPRTEAGKRFVQEDFAGRAVLLDPDERAEWIGSWIAKIEAEAAGAALAAGEVARIGFPGQPFGYATGGNAPAAPAALALDVETEIETPQWLWEAVHRALPRANIVCGGTHLMGYGTCQYIASGIAADVLARLANPEKP